MKLLITGTPGVGKTSAANELCKRLKCKAVNEKEFALKHGIGEWDNAEDELVVPLEKLEREMNKFLAKEKNVIVEGHLLCEIKLKVDWVILLKCNPELLEMRLQAKNYADEKIMDNVMCEGIDYCKKHVKRNYPSEKVLEARSQKNIKETAQHIITILKKMGALG